MTDEAREGVVVTVLEQKTGKKYDYVNMCIPNDDPIVNQDQVGINQ